MAVAAARAILSSQKRKPSRQRTRHPLAYRSHPLEPHSCQASCLGNDPVCVCEKGFGVAIFVWFGKCLVHVSEPDVNDTVELLLCLLRGLVHFSLCSFGVLLLYLVCE